MRYQRSFNLAAQLIAHHYSPDAVDLAAALEKDQHWHTINVPLVCQRLVLIHRHLSKIDLSLKIFANRHKLRLKYLTRVASFSREIDNNHLLRLQHLLREVFLCDLKICIWHHDFLYVKYL